MKLREQYNKEIAPALKDELSAASIMAVPRVMKITLNIGVGKYLQGGKDTSEIEAHLTNIAGQKAMVTRAKKSISNFKLRQGMPVGVSATLRGERAYDFLYKFINVCAPRIRDFRGFNTKSFDGKGNYSLGLKDIQIFPEINPESISKPTGMQITISMSGDSNENSKALLDKFSFPFRKTNQSK